MPVGMVAVLAGVSWRGEQPRLTGRKQSAKSSQMRSCDGLLAMSDGGGWTLPHDYDSPPKWAQCFGGTDRVVPLELDHGLMNWILGF